MARTLIEPFRIKSVEPIRVTTRAEREQMLEAAHLNVFLLRAEDVLIDAMDESKEARDAYAELMASPAAEKLRQLLAEHWAQEMWETRTHGEISAAIAAEQEALND